MNQKFHYGYRYFPFKEISLAPAGWPAKLSGLRIVQLSDLHLHKKVKLSYLRSLIEQINAIAPDLVVFTGDLIETKAVNIKPQLQLFTALQPPSYYVTGNHDIFYGPAQLDEVLESTGMVALDNRYETLEYNGTPFQLAGISDRYSFIRGIKRDIRQLFDRMDPDIPTILLAHQPKDIHLLREERVDLQLSGHTHGGQVLPFNYLARALQPYMHGAYSVDQTTLYVTSGLGYWGVPVRFMAPPEIPVITVQ